MPHLDSFATIAAEPPNLSCSEHPSEVRSPAGQVAAAARCAIATAVASVATGVAATDIVGLKRGSSACAEARAVAMYLAHVGLGLTLVQVGGGFGRHHSTVAHACHVVEDMREDETVDRWLDRLEAAVRWAAQSGGRSGE